MNYFCKVCGKKYDGYSVTKFCLECRKKINVRDWMKKKVKK